MAQVGTLTQQWWLLLRVFHLILLLLLIAYLMCAWPVSTSDLYGKKQMHLKRLDTCVKVLGDLVA